MSNLSIKKQFQIILGCMAALSLIPTLRWIAFC